MPTRPRKAHPVRYNLYTLSFRSWIPDDLGVPSFARLPELRPLPVASFDKRFDVWRIDAELSPGCGGPELPEEIML